jgi:outer membrane cobalamin receptor
VARSSHPIAFPCLVLARALAAIALALSIASPADAAEEVAASLSGAVVDPDGQGVPRASIVLETPAGVLRTASSDDGGRFVLQDLAAGAYTLRVTYTGLLADPLTVSLGAGERRDVRIPMRLSAISDTVLVSAAQTETTVASAPASVTVFADRDLAVRQFTTAAEALRVTPGISVAQSGGAGALTSVFPRGGESDYTLVLVDGVRLNAFGGGLDFSTLPAAGIERIEIVRGPQSALFGSDAIGGVVQIVTRHGGPPTATGRVEGASRGTVYGTGGASGSAGPWQWGASGERFSSDGFTGIAPGTGERVSNDDHDRSSGAASLRFSAPAGSLAAHLRLTKTERGFAGPFGSDPNGTFPGVDRVSRGWTDQRTAGLQGTLTFSPRLRVRGSGSWADLDSRFRSAFDTSISEARRIDTRVQADAALTDLVGLTGGMEVLDERARSTYITAADGSLLPVGRTVASVFGEARAEIRNRLTATAGVRVDRIRRDSLPGAPGAVIPRTALGEDVVVATSPRGAVSWFLREAASGPLSWTRVRGSAGTGIRPPDAFEIAFTDNPALAPERSRSLELGLEQALADARVVVEATWFHNRYDDLIVAVGRSFADASRYRTDNIANARARGVEAAVTARPFEPVHLRAAYTFLDAEVLAVDGASGQAPPPFEPGDPLIRRPRHQGWIEAVVTTGRWSAFARFGARGRVLDVDPSFGAFGGKLVAPGFATADLGGAFTVWRRLAVFGRIVNALDRRYEEALGYPAPGRTFAGGLSVAAGR